MAYLQRLSWLLRQGEPVRDVLLYLPTTDAYARLGTGHHAGSVATLAAMIDPRVIGSLRSAGYDLALLDDGLAPGIEPGRRPRRAAAGPSPCPPLTRTWLDAVEAAGGRVLTVDADDDAATLVGRHLAPDLTLHPNRADVGTVHRRIGDLDVHLVVNTGPHRADPTRRPAGHPQPGRGVGPAETVPSSASTATPDRWDRGRPAAVPGAGPGGPRRRAVRGRRRRGRSARRGAAG